VRTYQIAAKDGGSELVETYRVGGARPGTVAQYHAIVDKVIGASLTRLERYVETGKPE
jgi:hypothetical protein